MNLQIVELHLDRIATALEVIAERYTETLTDRIDRGRTEAVEKDWDALEDDQ